MNRKRLQLILLVACSVLSIGTLGALIFIGANTINDIKLSQISFYHFTILFFLVLSIGSVICAWFNKKIGATLILLSSVLIIGYNSSDFMDVSFYWQQGGLFVLGMLLLLSEIKSQYE